MIPNKLIEIRTEFRELREDEVLLVLKNKDKYAYKTLSWNNVTTKHKTKAKLFELFNFNGKVSYFVNFDEDIVSFIILRGQVRGLRINENKVPFILLYFKAGGKLK